MKHHSKEHGQALAEVIIATMVVILIATGLIASATVSLKNAQAGKSRSRATRYAQEGIEGARHLRNISWDEFVVYSGYYCYDEALAFSETAVASHDDCDGNIDSFFTRSIQFTFIDAAEDKDDRMQIEVLVSWPNPSKAAGRDEVSLSTFLTNWR